MPNLIKTYKSFPFINTKVSKNSGWKKTTGRNIYYWLYQSKTSC